MLKWEIIINPSTSRISSHGLFFFFFLTWVFINACDHHNILNNKGSKLTWFTADFSLRFKSTFQSILLPLFISLISARLLHRISTEMYEILWPLHVRIVLYNRTPRRTHVCEMYRHGRGGRGVRRSGNHKSDRLCWHLNLWLFAVA